MTKKEMIEWILLGSWRFYSSYDKEEVAKLMNKNKKCFVEEVYNKYEKKEITNIDAIRILLDKVSNIIIKEL